MFYHLLLITIMFQSLLWSSSHDDCHSSNRNTF